MRISIVGGGVIGMTIAHQLLDEGHAVEVIDRDGAQSSASVGNAGWIAHVDILPLASPRMWRHLPRWLIDPLGPLAISPTYAPRLAPWLWRFLAASRPTRIAASTRAIHALNAASLPAWEKRLADLGLSRLLRRRGILSVWTDRNGFAAAAAMHAEQAKLGIAVERLGAADVQHLESAFANSPLAGGALYPTGVHVEDPLTLLTQLRTSARSRGARLRDGEVVDIVSSPDGPTVRFASGVQVAADRVVLAAGAWSKALAARCGDRVPLDTERGYNITLAAGALGLTRPVMYEGMGFVTTPLDTGDRIGGSVEFAGLHAPPNWSRVDAMLGRLRRVLPDARIGAGERWMGFRPSVPDSLPVIGPAARDRSILYAFGHGHHGLTQAAATADVIAALVADRRSRLDPVPYSAQRF